MSATTASGSVSPCDYSSHPVPLERKGSMPPPPPVLKQSPASITALVHSLQTPSVSDKHHGKEEKPAAPRANILSVMKRLGSSLSRPPRQAKKQSRADVATTINPTKRRLQQGLVSVGLAATPSVHDQQLPKKKKRRPLAPPTLESCNRRVLGGHLRLPDSFVSGPQKSALKYARMSFPFSDRHLCALVPTALFSYSNVPAPAAFAETLGTNMQRPKYSHRRRVWLLVPHRQAPASIVVRRVLGPPEPNTV